MEDCSGEVRLNLGCGANRWEGWRNVDASEGDICVDLRELYFPPDYADAIAAIHVIEHFYAWEAADLLADWYRILKPGGKLILELPCMDKVIFYLHTCMQKQAPIHEAFSWFVFWGDPRRRDPMMCHRWGYTKEMMQQALIAAGFAQIEFQEPRYHFPMRDMRVEAIKAC